MNIDTLLKFGRKLRAQKCSEETRQQLINLVRDTGFKCTLSIWRKISNNHLDRKKLRKICGNLNEIYKQRENNIKNDAEILGIPKTAKNIG